MSRKKKVRKKKIQTIRGFNYIFYWWFSFMAATSSAFVGFKEITILASISLVILTLLILKTWFFRPGRKKSGDSRNSHSDMSGHKDNEAVSSGGVGRDSNN